MDRNALNTNLAAARLSTMWGLAVTMLVAIPYYWWLRDDTREILLGGGAIAVVIAALLRQKKEGVAPRDVLARFLGWLVLFLGVYAIGLSVDALGLLPSLLDAQRVPAALAWLPKAGIIALVVQIVHGLLKRRREA
ncbi:hypothetical protein [Larsenimonas suaedae]|uniref:Uncharacterized protein n=1 Tax=Larsenimonas suaedae TaxID=1851019 RepID=A0ABU1GVE6_9GAMM|nr:hypothetical protein [Larsenimonas suaedae]MCM2971307.1 hypothetical protein [Larsenimonas suaedae]MDR5896017.1 hypothetical protein [Larsenimonas suaedae]